MTTTTNVELIPIYTDWANRHLSKGSLSRPIRDISNEFRDYRLVSQLINVIVPINEFSPTFTKRLAKITSNLDGLETCLDYLKNLGLDCSKLTKTDIDSGNLGAVLQLLFLLSTYKQKLRQLKKDQKKLAVEQLPAKIMPPAVSKLPSPRVATSATSSTNQNSNFLPSSQSQMSTSRLLTPQSRLAKPDSSKIGIRPKTSGLKPPSASSANTNSLRPSSRSSGNNNVGSTISTSAKSLDSSSTYSSISNLSRPAVPSSSQIQKPIKPPPQQIRVATTTKIGSSKLAAPKAVSTPKLATVKTIGGAKSEQECSEKTPQPSSGMLKLKLFGNKNSSSSSPKPPRKAETTKITTVSSTPVKSGLRPPSSSCTSSKLGSATSMSKLCTPKINFRKTDTSASIPQSDSKRCSKSSEEESGYAGFNSTSPASSSTEGSFSMHSTSSKSSTSDDKSPSSDDLTLNASIVTTIRQPAASISPNVVSKPVEEKPTLAVKGVMNSTKKELIAAIPPTIPPRDSQPTIGVVSPIMAHKKIPNENIVSERIDAPEKLPPLNLDTEIPESPSLKSFEKVPPKMAPIRQPPTYDQLLKQGKITSPVKSFGYDQVESSTSEDSISAIAACKTPVESTTTRKPAVGHHSLERRMPKNKKSESSDYASDAGVAMCAKMREKLKEYDDMTRRAQNGYPDNFEDSSSLSSGVSDSNDLDDISTDDLSGIDMATIASKHSDYSHFVRPSSKARIPTRPSTSVDSRSRAEQENVYKLLSQCRTSQRGAATAASSNFGQHSLKSPGYSSYSHHLTVSADKDTMSMHSQTSRRASGQKPSYSGQFHSLDRKSHLQDFTTTEHRMAALLSPRRMPSSMSKHDSAAALNASGMSRSMILLESLSPRPPRRHQSPAASCIAVPSPSTPSRRSHSPRAPSARIPLSLASPVHVNNSRGSYSARSRGGSINGIYGESFQLHRLSDEKSPVHTARSEMGSQLSLASTTAYANLSEKYENAIREMAHELECYKNTVDSLTRKQENYGAMFSLFDQKIQKFTNNLERSNLRPEEAARFRQDLAQLRDISNHMSANRHHQHEGAGELLRQPSLESVASHRSSMSSSSKSSKQEKISLSSFGKSKKSWALSVDSQIRSSLSKFTKKKSKNYDEGHMPSISGSQGTLDNIDVIELRQELMQRDSALKEVRLDNLDRAREVDVLRETVNKLKTENKHLKKEMDKMANGPGTRVSSRASIPFVHDDDHVYDAACSSTSASQSSKRSSGCNSIKVTVNVDITGKISSIVCPDKEIIVGYLPAPTNQSTWKDIDNSILSLFGAYISRIDVEHQLGLDAMDAILGYQIGELRRVIGDASTMIASHPTDILQPTTTIRMFMHGAAQCRVDSLVLDMLLPKQMILQLVKSVLTEKRLVLAGASGIGKSRLAKALATYVALRTNQSPDKIVDIRIPDDDNKDERLKLQRRLETILKSKETRVVLLDNVPKNSIAFIVSIFSSIPLQNEEGPFVVCTANRYQILELQVPQNFKLSVMSTRLDGFMLRFLRRRAVEDEYREFMQIPSEFNKIIEFLPVVLNAVNTFIEKTNSVDVTAGPRSLLQCPLSIESSREWFIEMWNGHLIPYMEKQAREGKRFGRCTSFEDPTDIVTDKWPWFDGPNPEDVLRRLQLQDLAPSPAGSSRHQFNPLESLIQLHATKHPHIDSI